MRVTAGKAQISSSTLQKNPSRLVVLTDHHSGLTRFDCSSDLYLSPSQIAYLICKRMFGTTYLGATICPGLLLDHIHSIPDAECLPLTDRDKARDNVCVWRSEQYSYSFESLRTQNRYFCTWSMSKRTWPGGLRAPARCCPAKSLDSHLP